MIESDILRDYRLRFGHKLIALMAVSSFLLGGVGCDSKATNSGANMVQVFYLPIGMETLVGVSTNDLETRGKRCRIDTKRDVDKIMRILNSARPVKAPGEAFEDKTVRVKLVEETQQGMHVIAVVENQGSLKRGDGSEGVLSPSDLSDLKKIIEAHLSK